MIWITKADWALFSGALRQQVEEKLSNASTVAFFSDYGNNLIEYSSGSHNWQVKEK